MAARAIWKGVVHFGTQQVPVKLYSAVQERSVHFRLLHEKDKEPVKQQLISAESGDAVEYAEVKKAYPLPRGRLVVLEKEELSELEPVESRDIEITRFVSVGEIDHRWYERAYFLGPDNSTKAYFAAAAALDKKKKEGVAHWTMRGKEYIGALRVEDGYLMLITLRYAEEIIAAQALTPPAGRALAAKEVEMASQLLSALEGKFDPTMFRDEYRARVMELVETKSKGKRPKVVKFRAKKQQDDELTDVLAASLAGMKKAKKAG